MSRTALPACSLVITRRLWLIVSQRGLPSGAVQVRRPTHSPISSMGFIHLATGRSEGSFCLKLRCALARLSSSSVSVNICTLDVTRTLLIDLRRTDPLFQYARYRIVEELGCTAVSANIGLTYLIRDIWELFLPGISVLFYCREYGSSRI